MSETKTDFGYRQVNIEEKGRLVRDVFTSVARRYDVMNDLMSLGIHRLWKRYLLARCAVRSSDQILDLAGGTGDIARLLAPELGKEGQVVLSDINSAMLGIGRDRLFDEGKANKILFTQVNAECIPFADRSFNLVTIAFGLRNVTHKEVALREMYRVLKPGGRVLILEFSQVRSDTFRKLYDFYSFQVLPRLGGVIANDEASYRYLAESIRQFPNQETLVQMLESSGFERCAYENLSGGIVALHLGYRV